METITNTNSASVPFLYRYEEPREGSSTQNLAAFSLQLRIYLLLRAFFFFIIRKQLAILPPTARQPVSISPADENPLSPVPLVEPAVSAAVIPAKYAETASSVAGIAVDASGIDLELQKAVNAPSIRVSQQVEITRVNRLEFQKSGLFLGIYRAAWCRRRIRIRIRREGREELGIPQFFGKTRRCIWRSAGRSFRCWR